MLNRFTVPKTHRQQMRGSVHRMSKHPIDEGMLKTHRALLRGRGKKGYVTVPELGRVHSEQTGVALNLALARAARLSKDGLLGKRTSTPPQKTAISKRREAQKQIFVFARGKKKFTSIEEMWRHLPKGVHISLFEFRHALRDLIKKKRLSPTRVFSLKQTITLLKRN